MSEHWIVLLTELGEANLKVIQPFNKFSRQPVDNFYITEMEN